MAASFKEKDYVWHDKHGIGRVALFDEEGIMIEFDTGAEELFEIGSRKNPPLTKLDPAGFLLRLRNEPETLRTLAAENPADLVALLHTDFGESLPAARIERHIAGAVVDKSEFKDWLKTATAALKEDPRFVIEKGGAVTYLGDMSEIAGDLLHKFNHARNLKEKQRVTNEILKMEEKGLPVEDAKEAAITFFSGTASRTSNDLGARLEALHFLESLDPMMYKMLKPDLDARIQAQDVQDAAESLFKINDNAIRCSLLDLYKDLLAKDFIDIAFTMTKRYKKIQRDWVLDTLLADENKEYITTILNEVLRDVPTNQQPFVWFGLRMLETPDKLMDLGYERTDIIRRFFKLLLDAHITSAFSANPKEGPSVSREEDEIKKILVKKKPVIKLLKAHPDDVILLFAQLYMDNKSIPDEDKAEMLNLMRETWPGIDFESAAAAAAAGTASEIILSRAAFDRFEAEYRDIVDVQMPAISKEIGVAREFGDLSENAEYHAAKEKQGMLNSRMRYLERLIETAKILDE